MKIVIIIYAISLIILLAIMFNNRKNLLHSFRYEDWYVSLLGTLVILLAAPLIVLLLPFILKKKSSKARVVKTQEPKSAGTSVGRSKEEIDRANAEYERKRRIEQEQKDLASKRFDEAVLSHINECTNKHIIVAKRFEASAKNHDYNALAGILSEMVLPDGSTLGVQECGRTGYGDESRFYIVDHMGNRDFNVFNILTLESSCMGAWQAYLLHQARHYLPLWSHANNIYRDYIYTKDDLDRIKIYSDNNERITPDFSKIDIEPTIFRDGDHFFITCCFWSIYNGLVREFIDLPFKDGHILDFICFKYDVLYEYDCGIRFMYK